MNEDRSQNARWANRIVGQDTVDPSTLNPNPENWREHPASQRAALADVLGAVGWIDQVIVNKRTGRMIDGHLRVHLAVEQGETSIPVMYVDLNEDEERMVLASFDAITSLATTNADKLTELLNELSTADGAVGELMNNSDAALTQLLDDLTPSEPAPSDKLEVTKVCIDDPETEVNHGDVFEFGNHVLVCADVMKEWSEYVGYLSGDALLAPYPGPYVAFARALDGRRLIMVQPDTYIAGHIIDRWLEQHPGSVANKVKSGERKDGHASVRGRPRRSPARVRGEDDATASPS